MLIARWLLRLDKGFRFPDRYGPFENADRRKAFVAELREQDPKVSLLQVDVYANGEISVVVPTRENA